MEVKDASAVAQTQTNRKDPEQYFRTEHLKIDLKGRVVRGGALSIGAESIRQVLFIVSTVVLARLLSPSDNGLIAMVIVVTGFLDLFKDLGLVGAVIQRSEVNQRQMSTLFWINLAVGVGLALITAALAPVLAAFYEEPRLVRISVAMSGVFLFSGLTILHRALLHRQMRFTALAGIDVLLTAVEATVGIVAALAGFGYWSLVFMRLASALVDPVVLWIVCPWRPGLPERASGVRSMLAFGGNITGFKMALYLMRNVDNLLIARFYGPLQLGLYTKAYNLLLLPLQRINQPISLVALPALSRLADSPEEYRQAYTSIVLKVSLLTMPLVAFMIGTSDWLVLIVLGPQWIQSGNIFAWLGVAGLIEPFTTATVWLFFTQGRVRQQFHWGLMSATITIIAIIAGLPWGAVGVAAAYGLASVCIRTPLLFWFVGREGPVRTGDLYRNVTPFICAACATLLAIFAFRQWGGIDNMFLNLIVAGLITGVVTLLILALIPAGRPAIRDLKNISMLVFKRKVPA